MNDRYSGVLNQDCMNRKNRLHFYLEKNQIDLVYLEYLKSTGVERKPTIVLMS